MVTNISFICTSTGSGKGVGFVILTFFFWRDSVIVHDIKLENYELTSGWRKKNLKQKYFCGIRLILTEFRIATIRWIGLAKKARANGR